MILYDLKIIMEESQPKDMRALICIVSGAGRSKAYRQLNWQAQVKLEDVIHQMCVVAQN